MIQATYPLAPLQEGMLFNALYAPGTGIDVQQVVMTCHHPLNISAFQRAWSRIVERHAILRTGFRWEGVPEPLQDVHSSVDCSVVAQDWRTLSAREKQARLEAFLREDRKKGFDLCRPPLMRLALFRLDEKEYVIVWSNHHIIFDGRSRRVLLQEVFALYDAFCQGRDLELAPVRPYSDYVKWVREKDWSGAEAFWKNALADLRSPTPFPVNHGPVPDGDLYANHAYQEQVLTDLTLPLRALAAQCNVSLHILVQGAWALLISRYSGQQDIMFGATRACRRSALDGVGTSSMVGLLINTLPIRLPVAEKMPVMDWLREVREHWQTLRQYEHTPLYQIQGWSAVPRGTSLFESMEVFENETLNAWTRAEGGEWNRREFRYIGQTNYPLTLAGYGGDALRLTLQYYRPRVSDSDASAMLGHLTSLLQGMVDAPDRPVRDLPLLTAAERHQILVGWNDTGTIYPQDRCVHEWFEEQVARTPDAIAAKSEGQSLTYAELDARSNQLAHYLQRLAVGPEVMVGVYMERSLDMPVALLGILKAGGIYLPLDTTYPRDRVAFMLADAGAALVLTQANLVTALSEAAKPVCMDADWHVIAEESTGRPSSPAEPDNGVYVIYTSGSTGQPKGTLVSHRALCNFLLWSQRTFPLTSDDTVLQKTSPSFDASIWEFFAPLISGARLVMARPDGQRDPSYLVQVINAESVTVLKLVPSLLQVLLAEPGFETCTTLRDVFSGGEALPADLVRAFHAQLPATLHNFYGPTEATIDALFGTCVHDAADQVIPIGRPIANTRAFILDRELRPVPAGIVGELYLSGAALARGYLKRPELTADKFIPNPLAVQPGERLYATGDLARYLPDGRIEYRGRTDQQVKLRGFRIELGEIDARFKKNPRVSAAVTIVQEEPGNQQLISYVASQDEASVVSNELRELARRQLPDYMQPAAIVVLKALPLMPNGKVNRAALPAPDLTWPDLDQPFAAPRNEVEQVLANIWSSLLRIERVGIHDNFFQLGGHSLLATQLASRLRRTWGVDIPLRYIFQRPTIAELAAKLIELETKPGRATAIARARLKLDAMSPVEIEALLQDARTKRRPAL